jgi:hypothetical protein
MAEGTRALPGALRRRSTGDELGTVRLTRIDRFVPSRGFTREEQQVNIKGIADKVKDVVQKRGGTDALKEDAGELKDVASGEGSVADKAKEGFEAVKDPGAQRKD